MKTYIALLRAVNLGGHNRIAMQELRDLLSHCGMEEPRTLLVSGNAVFRSGYSATARLEGLLEDALKERLDLETDFLVRSTDEWGRLIRDNPFPDEARRDPGHFLVMCLKEAPERDAVRALQQSIVGREVVGAKGRQAYLVYPDGVGRSKLTNALIERKLGSRGTGRNWNTVIKLAALAG
ncbi:MAG TPA: DUF1697 domain-containing protein [Gemmatimonadales bacterium]|nr:DUF1697 domain-containing protein [Gemmatimonadales bacterium]